MLTVSRQHQRAQHPISVTRAKQHDVWVGDGEDNHLPEQDGPVSREKMPFNDSPRNCVRVAAAQTFLHQVWKELQAWTVMAVNAAQMMTTAIMNIILLSVVAVFAVLAVVVLFIRDQIMDERASKVVDAASQATETSEQLDAL